MKSATPNTPTKKMSYNIRFLLRLVIGTDYISLTNRVWIQTNELFSPGAVLHKTGTLRPAYACKVTPDE